MWLSEKPWFWSLDSDGAPIVTDTSLGSSDSGDTGKYDNAMSQYLLK